MEQEIIDTEGNVVEEKKYATWADLCEPPPVKEVQLRGGKWIKYRPWIPSDKMAEIQRKATKPNGKIDGAQFTTLILKEVMLVPRIETEADMRAAMKADSSMALALVNQTVDTETFNRLKEELGEG